ncbi:MAG: hypothetical protein JXQ71_11395 [Verrucomicrobia bacterium]|nr:hypothetical protein [Verrucomicrobiota bacterium]
MSPVLMGPETLLAEVPHSGAGLPHTYADSDVEVSENTTFHYTITATDLDSDMSGAAPEVSATVSVASTEKLVILTAAFAVKVQKLTVRASSTLGGAVTLSLYGGPDAVNIDYSTPLEAALAYDPASGEHSTRLRTTSPPAWVAVTSTGGGIPAKAPVTFNQYP